MNHIRSDKVGGVACGISSSMSLQGYLNVSAFVYELRKMLTTCNSLHHVCMLLKEFKLLRSKQTPKTKRS